MKELTNYFLLKTFPFQNEYPLQFQILSGHSLLQIGSMIFELPQETLGLEIVDQCLFE